MVSYRLVWVAMVMVLSGMVAGERVNSMVDERDRLLGVEYDVDWETCAGPRDAVQTHTYQFNNVHFVDEKRSFRKELETVTVRGASSLFIAIWLVKKYGGFLGAQSNSYPKVTFQGRVIELTEKGAVLVESVCIDELIKKAHIFGYSHLTYTQDGWNFGDVICEVDAETLILSLQCPLITMEDFRELCGGQFECFLSIIHQINFGVDLWHHQTLQELLDRVQAWNDTVCVAQDVRKLPATHTMKLRKRKYKKLEE